MRKFRTIFHLQMLFSKEREIKASQEAIDVIIPVIEKDLKVLPLCIEGVRTRVQNPINEIYVVAPKSEEFVRFCEKNRLNYVDEDTVLGFTAASLSLHVTLPNGQVIDRSGWLFQQMLKLSGAIGSCENYLCIDADHVLLQPHTFISSEGKPVFYMSGENHRTYYDVIRKLIGDVDLTPLSYVAHKMIFNRKMVTDLQNCIQEHTGTEWKESIIQHFDRSVESAFSEFEMYGNFVNDKILLLWNQRAMDYRKIADYKTLLRQYGQRYRSITFPEYYNSSNVK